MEGKEVSVLWRRSKGLHWGVCDTGRCWWRGCLAAVGPSRHRVQLARGEDPLLYTPALQLLLYDINSSSALCREASARWEPDGSGTCVGSGL